MPKPSLILPVENQVRELDAKLLLACLGAQRGHACLIGWKGLIDYRVGRFPPSIYFAKSMTNQNAKMLRIKRKLGHYVAAWDEEAVVHYPPEIYYARRVGLDALDLIDIVVAWGEDNRLLLEGHPDFRDTDKIRVLGNPRADLLRPEFRSFFDDQVAELKQRYGDFILINTNFGSINGYSDTMNLLCKVNGSGDWVPGRGSLGMPAGYARGLFDYRMQIFEAFQDLIPGIAAAFPDKRIILRPHPAEDHGFWRKHLQGFENVQVIGEGNVIPWLLACDSLVHNGCTTAVEGYLLGARILSFVPVDDERYEFALPNKMGQRCHSAAEVLGALAAPAVATASPETDSLLSGYICSLKGELAAERIIDAVSAAKPQWSWRNLPALLVGRVRAEYRALVKQIKQRRGVARYDRDFMRQRFPKLTLEVMQAKADRLVALTDPDKPVKVYEREEDLFEVRAA